MLRKLISVSILALTVLGATAYADCQQVKDGQKSDFNGDSLNGLAVDKSSMALLNREFPELAVTEQVYTGNQLTCTDCKDNYVSCTS